MKKRTTVVTVSATLVVLTGFSVVEGLEYFQVARKCVSQTIRENIPLNVEIERMEVILGKLDSQVAGQKHALAKAQVALEDAEARLAQSQEECQKLICDMRSLRDLQCQTRVAAAPCGTVKVGGYSVSAGEITRALAYKLATWKSKTATSSVLEDAVTKQREAYRTLATRYDDWQQKRSLLAQRLDTLRARYAANQPSTAGTRGFQDGTDLARATELADEIEQRLRVIEKQQALGANSADQLLLETPKSNEDISAEVDRILEGK